MSKVWTVENKEETYTDKELKKMIKDGELNSEDIINSSVLEKPVKIGDTIYSVFVRNK